MNGALARFQAGFAAALLAEPGEGGGGLAQQPAFAVYRNTVMKGCIDALEANYPSVARLVGAEWLRAAAAAYVREHPPRDGRLLVFGEAFADFLATAEPAREFAHLADVARLDRCWTESHTAADADAAAAATLAALPPDALGALRLRPHPSARWHWFDGAPVFALWRRCREDHEGREGPDAEVDRDGPDPGDGALIVRRDDVVGWSAASRADCAFLDACANGAALAGAAAAALAADAATDIAALLARLLRAGALAAPLSTDPETP